VNLLRAASLALKAMSAANDGPVLAEGIGSVTAGPATVTVTGGVAPYTYSSAYLSGDTVTIVGGSSSTPSFSRSGVTLGQNFTGVVRTTVTDAASRTTTTDITWQITGAI
jgi:hypothetical protein